jgi:uncharacterized protein (DUF2235 family)
MALYAFDGTWNSDKENDDSYTETNVVRFFHAYDDNSRALNPAVNNFYVSGIGTRLGDVGRAIGGAFGAGEVPRLNEAYERLCENWVAGDHTIDVIGFSRGAATALDFLNLVCQRGIRKPHTFDVLDVVKLPGHDRDDVIDPAPKFRFVGLWDVVGAFGVGAIAFDLPDLNIGHKLRLPKQNIEYCFHAMALDEVRTSFNVIRVNGAHEVWFRGVHSDIGGGNDNRGLNDITMKWMMLKAKDATLPITDAQIAALQPDPKCAAQLHKLPDLWRPFKAHEIQHYSVAPEARCRPLPGGCDVEDEQEERVAQPVGAAGIEAVAVPQDATVSASAGNVTSPGSPV